MKKSAFHASSQFMTFFLRITIAGAGMLACNIRASVNLVLAIVRAKSAHRYVLLSRRHDFDTSGPD